MMKDTSIADESCVFNLDPDQFVYIKGQQQQQTLSASTQVDCYTSCPSNFLGNDDF